MTRYLASMPVLLLVAVACSSTAPPDSDSSTTPATEAGSEPDRLVGSDGQAFPPAPVTPEGPLTPADADALKVIVDSLTTGIPMEVIRGLADSEDPRVLWVLADLSPFAGAAGRAELASVFEDVTGTDLGGRGTKEMIDRLIAWDTPAPSGYREMKGEIKGIAVTIPRTRTITKAQTMY